MRRSGVTYFAAFLLRVLRKALHPRLEYAGRGFPRADIKQHFEALQMTTLNESGKRFAVRSQCQGSCGKIFQAVNAAIPLTMRELRSSQKDAK